MTPWPLTDETVSRPASIPAKSRFDFENSQKKGVVATANPHPAYASDSTLCGRVIVGDYDNLGETTFPDFLETRDAGHLSQMVCSDRSNFLDFSKIKGAGLTNQAAAQCDTFIDP
jgi:hypothetical protein